VSTDGPDSIALVKYRLDVRTEDCVRPGAIFRPYGWKNGRRKLCLPSVWMKDCVSRCYFLSVWTEVGLHVAKLLSSIRKDGKLYVTRRYFPSGDFCSCGADCVIAKCYCVFLPVQKIIE